MANENPFIEMMRFAGVNNVDDPVRLSANEAGYWPLTAADNIDIDNTGRIILRPGYTNKISLTKPHSLWANGDDCFFVYQDKLYGLNTDYSYSIIKSGLRTNARMSFVRVNDKVYYSNGTQIGYVHNMTDYLISDPAIEFKFPLIAGKFIEYYKGRIYVAQFNVLWFSDVNADYYDIRKNFVQFEKDIDMIIAVDTGLYVSEGNNIWFLQGDSPFEMGRRLVYDSGAIQYTALITEGQYIGSGIPGKIALWMTLNGLCVAGSDGNVINTTKPRYTINGYNRGSSLIKYDNGKERLLVSLTN